jgi:predicted nucleotidyltransferase
MLIISKGRDEMTNEAAISALVSNLAETARTIQTLQVGSDERKTQELVAIYLEQALAQVQDRQREGHADPAGSIRQHYESEAARFRARDTKPSSVRSATACEAVVATLS